MGTSPSPPPNQPINTALTPSHRASPKSEPEETAANVPARRAAGRARAARVLLRQHGLVPERRVPPPPALVLPRQVVRAHVAVGRGPAAGVSAAHAGPPGKQGAAERQPGGERGGENSTGRCCDGGLARSSLDQEGRGDFEECVNWDVGARVRETERRDWRAREANVVFMTRRRIQMIVVERKTGGNGSVRGVKSGLALTFIYLFEVESTENQYMTD
ncbi:hypothetical protein C8Q76DRAFT_181427 [Earliella scabrosa]|nr:hypothetical protein C8Q76DRAFT_181427 [Earliella scabrosa]